MRPERDRVIARELAAWDAAERERGVPLTVQARDEMQRTLERRHRSFPFGAVLGVCVLAAIGAGARRSAPSSAAVPLRRGMLAIAAAFALGAITVVIALDAAVNALV